MIKADYSGLNPEQVHTIEDALRLLERIIATGGFKIFLTDMKEPRLSELFTRQLIVIEISHWEPKSKKSSALASTDNGVIGLSLRAVNQSLPDLAATIAHEMTHTVGFGHSFLWTPWRRFSVSYLVQAVVARIGKKL